jgi:dolichol-phosphate mannosyltransferase
MESGADLVVASRYAPQGGLSDWSRFRHLISQAAILLTLPLQRSGIRVRDPMSGFFLVRRSCVQGVNLHQKGFKILLDILVRGDIHSATEVPFTFGHRYAGRSKASLGVGVAYLALLWKLWRNRRRN